MPPQRFGASHRRPTGRPMWRPSATSVAVVGVAAALCISAIPAQTSSQQGGQPIVVRAATRMAAAVVAAAPAPGTLTRVAGPDRIATAIAASQAGFPTDKSAAAAVVARADQFADALAGGPLAARFGGPLLLTPSGGITTAVAAEILRVLPAGHTVYLLGGPQALAPTTDSQVTSLGFVPARFAGLDRYETAIKIAQGLGDPTSIFEADGTSFPDGLSAGPAASVNQGVVVLTIGGHLPAETSAYLTVHAAATRFAIGGPAAAADPQALGIVGTDRYETSVAVARKFFTAPSTIGVAGGAAFPDALSGGPVTALASGPLILVPPAGALPASAQGYFAGVSNTVLSAWLFGGTAAISTSMAGQVAQALVLVPPPS